MAVQDTTLRGTAIPDYGNEFVNGDSGTSTLAILVVLARRKLLILGATLAATAVAAIGVSRIQDDFKAEAVIMPPQQQQSSLSSFASGAIGGLTSSGMASQLGLKNPADIYIGFLRSHTIADVIIARFHLQDVYRQRFLSDTRSALSKRVNFTSGKESLITIAVQDHDPQRAAAMANAFVDQLYRLNSGLAVTDASQRRLFFEQRLGKEKDALNEAEVSLKTTQQSTGLVVPAGQAGALVSSATQLRAEIASREVSLEAARSYGTDQNPRIQVLQREISTMHAQLSHLVGDEAQGPHFGISAAKLPEVNLEYFRKIRDLRYHETLYELLAKQYEAALIDEAKQAPVIQVVDRASAPDKKSGPARATLTMSASLLTVVLSSVYVLVVQHVRTLLSDPSQAETVIALRSAIRFRK